MGLGSRDWFLEGLEAIEAVSVGEAEDCLEGHAETFGQTIAIN